MSQRELHFSSRGGLRIRLVNSLSLGAQPLILMKWLTSLQQRGSLSTNPLTTEMQVPLGPVEYVCACSVTSVMSDSL